MSASLYGAQDCPTFAVTERDAPASPLRPRMDNHKGAKGTANQTTAEFLNAVASAVTSTYGRVPLSVRRLAAFRAHDVVARWLREPSDPNPFPTFGWRAR